MIPRTSDDDRLSELLLTLSIETDMSMQAVRSAIEEAPEFEAEILAFALEWGVMGDDGYDENLVHSTAPANTVWAAEAVRNPFANKSAHDLRAIATLSDLPFSLLSKLCQCLIDATTIPLALVRSLASQLQVDPGELFAFLDLRPQLPAGDFKSTVRPEVSSKVSFADAVRTTDMSAQQRDKWLSLVE